VSTSSVRADFDRIALLPESWDHNSELHEFLLAQLPARCEAALEVGCGTGAFSRRLAARAPSSADRRDAREAAHRAAPRRHARVRRHLLWRYSIVWHKPC